MKTTRRHLLTRPALLALLVLACALAVPLVPIVALADWTPVPVATDPLVRMPGSQPDQSISIEGPSRCLNCHAGYDEAVEPGFAWKGSMMAQAARDPIFWACLTVAAQDSIWALGNPNATDLCLRCHFPGGWLAGRSDPTNASLMRGDDYDAVQCDFCHRMYDPFAKTTFDGSREGSDWSGYWDEAGNTGPGSNTLSQVEATKTYNADLALYPGIKRFSGQPFYSNDEPVYAPYRESTSGQFFVSTSTEKRASFADAVARHASLYSRFHKSRYFCATCHDVSNPVFANMNKPLPDLSGGKDLMTEQYSAARYYHVERTFSEFMLSDYGRGAGAATTPEFQAQGAPGITWAAKCQDCHMRDVVGKGADKNNAPIRPTESTEHPNSGMPHHDLTGGNAWITHILASLDPNGPVHDQRNAQILGRGPTVLTLDLRAGFSPFSNGKALKAGSDRALTQLRLAATVKDLRYNPLNGQLRFKVQNNTGHKLISGFPEGRRMFVNVRLFAKGGALLEEVNPYDMNAGTLRGLAGAPSSPPLGPNERYEDALVYEAHTKSSLTNEKKTFHFVLATGRSKDNRIPPKGFDIIGAQARICEPVWNDQNAPGYFTAAEYAGGYDDVALAMRTGGEKVEVTVYYQGTSREYVEFLRDEINGTKQTLPSSAYIAQTDPFFNKLKAWGNTIWDLWYHNHGLDQSNARVPGIVPYAMTQTTLKLPYLYHTGTAAPGSTIVIRVLGAPGSPVIWAVSLNENTLNPPITLPGINGFFHLNWPFALIPLGQIGPSGEVTLPLPLPPNIPKGSEYPTQALVGVDLSNLHEIEIED